MTVEDIKSAVMKASPDCKVEVTANMAIVWIDTPDELSHHTLINLKGADQATAAELDRYIGNRIRQSLLAKIGT